MKLMVTNRGPDGAAVRQKEFQNITVDVANHGIIFQGKIVLRSLGARARPTRCSRSGPRTRRGPQLRDGQHDASARIDAATAFQHRAAGDAAIWPELRPRSGAPTSRPRLILEWVTLFGMARDVLANIAKTKNASVSYQNGQVTTVPKGGSAPGGAIVLNS